MSRAFPPREDCDRIPDDERIPLDTHPMMPKDTSGGPGAGGPDQIPSAGSPMAEADVEPVEPPTATSLGSSGGGGDSLGTIVQVTEDGADGEVDAKAIVFKANLADSPNFKQSGDTLDLAYFKL